MCARCSLCLLVLGCTVAPLMSSPASEGPTLRQTDITDIISLTKPVIIPRFLLSVTGRPSTGFALNVNKELNP